MDYFISKRLIIGLILKYSFSEDGWRITIFGNLLCNSFSAQSNINFFEFVRNFIDIYL